MPDSRLGYAVVGGLIIAALAAAGLVTVRILTFAFGDPRWWLVIALLFLVGFLVEWRHRS